MRRAPRRHAWRLVPVAVGAWIAAGALVMLPDASGLAASVAWGAVVLGAVVMWHRPARALAVGVVGLSAVAAVATSIALSQPSRQEAVELVAGERAVTSDVAVTGRMAPGPSGDVWFDAALTRMTVGERTSTAAVPVRVGVPPDALDELVHSAIGATLRVTGVAFPADPGERAVVVIRAGEVRVDAPAAPVLEALDELRSALARSADGLPQPGGGLVPGLAVGDESGLAPGLDDAMTAASLSHLTAVSGANCAIVVGLAFGLAALCGAGRGVRIGVGLAALALFVVLVTPEPSVVRAAAMAAIGMLAVALGRAGAALATLCVAIVVLLVVDPWLALSLGFALSAAATAALILLAGPLADGLSRMLPRPVALALSVPLAAQLACAPIIVLIDPAVPLLGVLANLLAAPAAPLATVAGFLATLAAPLPWVQDGLVALAWVPASWIAGVAEATAGVAAQRLPWATGIPGVVSLAVVSAATAVAIVVGPGARPVVRLVRAAAIVVVAGIVGATSASVALRTVAGPLTVPGEWRIVACDVGQGDAVLVRSAQSVALIDAGPDPDALTACLDRFGIRRLDLLVLTHFDVDHSGAAAALTGRVGLVLHGPAVARDEVRLRDELADAGAEVRAASAGMTGALGDARWRVVWPEATARAGGNDESVVVEFEGADLPRILLLGDLSREPQSRLRARLSGGAYDVVKVSHHGSADQDPALYDRIAAPLALVSVGEGNDYGHPRTSTLDMLRADGTAIARTDADGTIAVWREDGRLRWWRG